METKTVIKCGDGWKSLYQPLIDDIIKYDLTCPSFDKKIGVQEVREKIGNLSIEVFHPHNTPQYIRDRIAEVRIKSDNVCEFCGTTEGIGHSVNGFRKVCCKNCYDKHVKPNNPYSFWSDSKQYKSVF